MKNVYLLSLLAATLLAGEAAAQKVTTGREGKKADVNFTELANYYKEHPQPLVRKMPFDEEEEEHTRHFHKAPPAGEVHLYKKRTSASGTTGYHDPLLPISPIPNDSFLSTTSPGSSIPPDTHGAVDSQYCVTAINTTIRIQTRSGANVMANSLDGFWASVLPAGTGAFDPRIHYDPYNKKWILVTDAVASGAMDQSTLLIGVTVTSDPTGSWHLYSVPVDPSGDSWLDFPNVGFNNKWITITGNMFPNTSGGASGAVVYVFRYDSILAGVSAPYTKISKSTSFTICPALTYDPTETSEFCVETWNPGSGQLRLWKITGPTGSPTMTSVGYPATTQHWHGSGGSANFGPQLGGTTSQKIDMGDDRITSCMFRNGKLWTAHNVFLPSPGTATRTSIMWWQMDTLANPLQVGLINNPVGPTFYAYPSIAVNKYDDALIGCGVFSSTLHPSAAFAWHLHTDPADSTHPPFIYRHGQDLYFTTFGGSKNRWGDYSGTSIDPRNDEDFWTIQETSIPGALGSANWDTWWANIQICPKPHAPTLAWPVATPTPCPGDTLTYRIHPVPGATSYTWLLSGTGWTGAGSDTSFYLTAGTSRDTLTVYASNGCGQGESTTFYSAPPALPATPYINITDAACTGDTSAIFTASSPGATSYAWQLLGTGWSGTSTTYSINAHVGTGPVLIVVAGVNSCGQSSANDTMIYTPGNPSSAFTLTTHNTMTGVNVTATYAGTPDPGNVYTWWFNGGIATPGTGIGPHTVHWTTPGTDTVRLSVLRNGCLSTSSDTVNVRHNVGVPGVNGIEDMVSIVPNPNNGVFDIVLDRHYTAPVLVTITDVSGKNVYTSKAPVTGNKISVTTNSLPPGVYTVTIIADDQTITKKISVTK